MPRYKLVIEYDGRPFVGWQRQENGPSVQQAVEQAGAALSGAASPTQAAGRTDAGVHARAMTAHIDLGKHLTAEKVRDALNFHLKPAPIAILAAAEVSDEFHARFSCTGRSYEYRMINRRAPLTLEQGLAWRISGKLDHEAMHDAAQILVGKHDFSSFRASACQSNSSVKTLSSIGVARDGDLVTISCAALSFLHHQVRFMTGSLVEVGLGKWSANDLREVLEARDCTKAGQVAPAGGLYFMGASYPDGAATI
ncbi:MAG: tRNA pseudouridine(38-40) synthase TruA [Marinicaulis sp.]|nr:tRNA pseudouridine(38-40) synthase TruA [Marinicaulis sp.]